MNIKRPPDFSPVCVTSAIDDSAAEPEPEKKRRMRSKALDERPSLRTSTWSQQTMLDYADALAEASKAAHDATHAARAAGGDTNDLYSSPNPRESPGETTPRLLPSRSLSPLQSMKTAPSSRAIQPTTFEFLHGGGGAPQQQQQQRCSSLADAAARSSQTVMAARASMTTRVYPAPPSTVRLMPLASPSARLNASSRRDDGMMLG